MIVIRECEGHDELEACVQLQVETWGYDQTDVIPRKAFLVMQKIGGQVIGSLRYQPARNVAKWRAELPRRFCHVFAGSEAPG